MLHPLALPGMLTPDPTCTGVEQGQEHGFWNQKGLLCKANSVTCQLGDLGQLIPQASVVSSVEEE